MDISVPPALTPFLVVGAVATAIVAIAKAGAIMKRFVGDPVARWLGGVLDDRIVKTAEPLMAKHSPNGQLDRIEGRLDDAEDDRAELRGWLEQLERRLLIPEKPDG